MLYTGCMNISNSIFVVTGAGGGIGGELVIELLQKGAKVAAVDLRNESLDAMRARARVDADSLRTYAVDITDREAVMTVSKNITKDFGAVDGLINCAGIIQPFVKVNDLDYDAIDRVMNVNFYGTLYMVKAFLPHLLTRDEAYVTNVASMGGFLPVPGQSVYGASKAAVKLLTEGLYAELLDTPVHVSVVFPGATKTDITKNSAVKTPGGAGATQAAASVKMLAADEAARIIVKGIEKNKPQIFTGSDSRLMNTLYRFSPVRATRLIASQMKALLS